MFQEMKESRSTDEIIRRFVSNFTGSFDVRDRMSLNLDQMTIREPLCHIVTPIGMLGYGFCCPDLEKGLEIALQSGSPTAIILDSGSTDSGPAKLALGSMTCPRSAYERDLRQLIRAVKKYCVPLLISSAGGDGSDAHVKEFLDIIREILESSDQW